MKKTACILGTFLVWSLAHADTAVINWGNAFPSTLLDSSGATNLDSASYHIQLGTFETPTGDAFDPEVSNVEDWQNNWKVFDEAELNEDFGYFSSGLSSGSVMNSDGTSQSPDATAGFDFSQKDAFIWIFNQQTVEESTEWFLGRVAAWTFPNGADFAACCGEDFDQQWSLSSDFPSAPDASVDVVFGGYNSYEYEGGGVYESTGDAYLVQTYSPVPEAGTLWLSALSLSCAFLFFQFRGKGRRA